MSFPCKVPFCENTIDKKSYIWCWVHRYEKEKYKVPAFKFVMPLWAVKICKVHGPLKESQTCKDLSNPFGTKRRCKKCNNEKWPYCPVKAKIANQRNKHRRKEQKLKKDFNISFDDYNLMVIKQNNLCAICGEAQCKFQKGSKRIRSLAIDHNHKTGKIRSLLCTSCNTGIGLFEENIQLLEKAINYLRHHKDSA